MTEMWRQMNPPITRQQRAAAAWRLGPENETWQTIRWPDGTEMKWLTGTVDLRDYTLRDGYVVHVAGLDRFGWPVGHPDSPVTP